MTTPALADFPLDPGITPLNHASFGVSTRRLLADAEDVRRRLEGDPDAGLGESLLRRVGDTARRVQDWLGLPGGELALTRNATEAAGAATWSLPLRPGQRVVVLSCEYSSVVRGWQVRCRRAGAEVVTARVPLPLESSDDLLVALDRCVSGPVAYLQASQVSSSAALLLPLRQLRDWVHGRGGELVVDAAHGPGHVPLAHLPAVTDLITGTLHKWLPVPRAVGLLWAAGGHRERVRPSEVSLTYDAASLAERFAWPGTYDPAPRLVLPAATAQWDAWEAAGLHAACVELADEADRRLESVGCVPVSAPDLRAPRLRAVLLPGVPLPSLRAALADRSVRAWTGESEDGRTVLRLATHVYNDADDVDRVVDAVRGLLAGPAPV